MLWRRVDRRADVCKLANTCRCRLCMHAYMVSGAPDSGQTAIKSTGLPTEHRLCLLRLHSHDASYFEDRLYAHTDTITSAVSLPVYICVPTRCLKFTIPSCTCAHTGRTGLRQSHVYLKTNHRAYSNYHYCTFAPFGLLRFSICY